METPMNGFKKILNKKGMTLIEVMIIATVMSIMSLGMATLFKNITNTQSKTASKAALYDIKDRIEYAIRSTEAWSRTVNNAANNGTLACLRDGNTCATTAVPVNGNLLIADVGGAVIFNGTGAGNGFDQNGDLCAGWAAGGNDACPFRYTFSWTFTCPPDANPCPNPQVNVSAVLLYSPAAASEGNHRFNLDEFQINVNRNVSRRFEPFEVRFRANGADGTYGNGGGACRTNVWVPRPLNEVVNFNNLASADTVTLRAGSDVLPPHPQTGGGVGPAVIDTGEFRLRRGTYECTIMAQGYSAVDGFQIRLRDVNNGVGPFDAGGSMGALDTVTYSTGTVSFSIRVDTWFRVEHRCLDDLDNTDGYAAVAGPAPATPAQCNYNASTTVSARLYGCHALPDPPWPAGSWEETAGDDYSMGIPTEGYGAGGDREAVFTSISCVRSS